MEAVREIPVLHGAGMQAAAADAKGRRHDGGVAIENCSRRAQNLIDGPEAAM